MSADEDEWALQGAYNSRLNFARDRLALFYANERSIQALLEGYVSLEKTEAVHASIRRLKALEKKNREDIDSFEVLKRELIETESPEGRLRNETAARIAAETARDLALSEKDALLAQLQSALRRIDELSSQGPPSC